MGPQISTNKHLAILSNIIDNTLATFDIRSLAEYENWYKKLDHLTRAQIEKRLATVKNDGHFGNSRHLVNGLCEMKFNNGLRIYFFRSGHSEITLILGGTKHAQSKDIKKAKNIFYR